MAVRDTILSLLCAFAVTAGLLPWAIPFLHRLKFGQQVRDDGPQSHLKKQGTPTMGGITIVLGIIVPSLLFASRYPHLIPVLGLTAGFGLTGFLDDYLKIVKKQSEGLNPKQKLLLQLVFTGLFAVYMLRHAEAGLTMLIPFAHRSITLPAWAGIPALFFIVLGTDNGTNFTDGIDGLLSSVTIPVAVFFAAVSLVQHWGIAPLCGAVIGSLMGFLMFNAYPAKIFMGDTGSLAIGGFVAGAAYMTQLPLFIVIIGFIYFIEVVSVIIQVGYFKRTHGKRFFRMAPIHHHFELGGWSETQVVTRFTMVTVILCLIGYLAL